jgi:SIR2-like domain
MASKRTSVTDAAQREQNLSALAEALLVRHLQESWPFGDEDQPTWFGDSKPPPRYHEQIRTVAVVGAGASLPVKDIATDLAEELEKEEKDHQARNVELDRLESVYGLHRDAFETRLMALCRTSESERDVRLAISTKYRLRHPSLFTYEVLAHLLNHRYLDLIISYNFDELLDQSIEDELGSEEYTRVVTEGGFDPTRGVNGPLYVKMHGSATEPDSLRFTHERYYWTPRSIIKLVEDKFDVDNLVIITLGFKMDSFDFQHLLRRPKGLEIYHLDPYALSEEVLTRVTEQRKKTRDRKETERSADTDEPSRVANFAVPNPQPGSEFLDNVIGEIVKELEKLCDDPKFGPAEWRSILRHQAVVKLIDGTDLNKEQRHARYLRRRTILEIAFTAAKGRGVVSIASMVSDRCGRYYDLYRQIAGESADDWLLLCKAGGLVESPAHPDTYEVLPEVRRNSVNQKTDSNDIHKFHLADPQKLAEHTAKYLGLPRPTRPELVKLLAEALKYLQRETEIEIHSCDDRVCSKLFTKPKQLKTLTSLRGWTRELLLNTEFDELWYVAETGDWILEPHIQDIVAAHCSKIRLIQAFDASVKIPKVETKTRQLPWGRHNRHMTILRSKNESRAAIYFVRRLRSPTVTPVYLADGAEDLRRVTVAFEKLWEEAESYEKERKRLGG